MGLQARTMPIRPNSADRVTVKWILRLGVGGLFVFSQGGTMKPRFAVLMLVALLVAFAIPVDARVEGTLNFQNITSTNVVQTVAEVPNNEKEVEVGDFDNDGDLDVVIASALSASGTRRNKLYRNDGGVLIEVSGAPVIPGFSSSDTSRNAFLRDFDGDGWLDIIIINDDLSPGQAGQTKFFSNKHLGDVFSHFQEETFRLNGATGASCGGVSVDVDDDGAIDLYLGNYPGPAQDTMYLNDSTGFFDEVTDAQVPIDGDYTVDVSAADMNGDGTVDLLVSNHFDPNFLYYNHNLAAGSGLGDFRYSGSTQQVGAGADSETAMEPADFDNDGRIDIYYSNRGPGTQDRILQNTGNDANNKVVFADRPVVPGVATDSRKATVADLNQDGRVDVVVMGENRRPFVLRNTSEKGFVSFVDWTPGHAFPGGPVHAGWHAAVLDTDGDGWSDILVGGTNDDHLFRNSDSNELEGAALLGTLPAFHDLDPLAVSGNVDASQFDLYEAGGIPSAALVSVVLRGCSDMAIEVRDFRGDPVASGDRGGAGVDEAFQFTAPGGSLSFDVSADRICGDGDNDGDVDVDDFRRFRACVLGGLNGPICNLFDFNQDNVTDADDFGDFQNALTGPGGTATDSYVLEVLSRN